MLFKTTTTASSSVVVALSLATIASAASATVHEHQQQEFISPKTLYGENYERLKTKNLYPRFFNPESSRLNQKPGYHYKDDVRLSLAATLDDDSKQLLEFLYKTTSPATGATTNDNEANWDLHMVVDSITRKSESDPINLKTDITIEELEMSLKAKSMNMDLDCIGNHLDDHNTISTTHIDSNAKDCYGLLDLVGKTETVETDPEGDLVSIKRFDGTTVRSPEGLDKIKQTTTTFTEVGVNYPNSLKKQFQAQQFAASSHYHKHTEILKWLPDHPVSPGDEWNDSVDMMDSLGAIYTGTSALMGYAECMTGGHNHGHDHDCAVFTMDGILHVDNLSTWFKSLLGGDDDELNEMIDFADNEDWLELTGVQITNTIVWNTIDDAPQWMQANISMYVDITHPNFNNGKKTVSIPINFIMEFGSRIISRPDGGTGGGSSSEEILPTTNHTGMRSILVNLFSFTIIGSFVMAMYMLVKKAQQQQQHHQHERYYGNSSSGQTHHYVLSLDEQQGNTNTVIAAAAESELPNMI